VRDMPQLGSASGSGIATLVSLVKNSDARTYGSATASGFAIGAAKTTAARLRERTTVKKRILCVYEDSLVES
jgi:hypothetical protein